MLQAEGTKSGHKRMLRILFGCFIGMLLLFTLFSNTLLSLTLPKVATVEARNGELVHRYQGSGVLKYRDEFPLMNTMGWKVTNIAVKEGDLVKKGDTLVVYDSKEAEQQIEDEQANLQKLKLGAEESQHLFKEATINGDETIIRNAKRDMQMEEIEIKTMNRKIEQLQNELVSNSKLIAPFTGIVIKVNAVEGLNASNEGADIILANGNKGLEFEFTAPAKVTANLKLKEKIAVNISSTAGNKKVEGVIAEIENTNAVNSGIAENEDAVAIVPMKRILITINDFEARNGDSVVVDLVNKTEEEILLLPNKAIHEDGSGSYVYIVEGKQGPLGNTFYARRVSITVIDSNEHESAVEDFAMNTIILESSHPLQDGGKIRTNY
ncbi:biotin/lipoyl-binding protein [Paenibacillus sp. GSMTC-2017]|uniref:efflux RND transporter periplasmic adaptor subunit n=1 Tax=Paenibacillus sp. GSMTC-2017 TaxID=2794350 RepID=UPI0018D631ED|nr:biotin/lipoyl-binding protein [Paenibacillus sp. GSMTC-2017]MBH5320916.1 biotin/lipoyl-binding protein [Paenibacillus sp. GSMTC-2017]